MNVARHSRGFSLVESCVVIAAWILTGWRSTAC